MKNSQRQCIQFESGSSHLRFFHLVAAAIAIATTSSGIVKGDVLYDTTWITDDLIYDAFAGCYIGGVADQGILTDTQVADDFDLIGTNRIGIVTADFLTSHPDEFPADGVLIEIFEDLDGIPSESPVVATISNAVTTVGFENILFGEGSGGVRIQVDLSDEEIILDSGRWWLSVIPVDVSPTGARYSQTRKVDLINGEIIHVRDGGSDHGNGYPGIWGTDDWWPITQSCICFPSGDLAMRIEGNRIADFDGDGVVGTSDLIELLSMWGPCPPKGDCLPDLDDSGEVGTNDLIILLSQWG